MSSIKMKKFVSIKGVIENIRQSVNSPAPVGGPGGSAGGPVRLEQEIIESLIPDQFTAEFTVRHGFPFKPLSMAYDPIQHLLAIGTRCGEVRIFGRPGLDMEIRHESDCQILQIIFIVNEGRLLTACSDDTLNLWDFKKKRPELVQTLKLQREHLTFVSLEFMDKWIYIGTDRGNVYIMHLDSFQLSGYQISWNKAIDPLQKSHPGAISHLSVNPADSSKILIGFESGSICLWDLSTKKRDQGYFYNQRLYSISWHMEGRQFVCSHGDGSLVTWNVKPANGKPANVVFPHGKKNKDGGNTEPCDPIEKVVWRVGRNSGDSYFVFSGGLTSDVTGVTPSITFMQGKSTTLLEMEYCVLDFVLASDSPYSSDYQEPESIIAMLSNDLVAIDCKSPGYPCFNNPYAMDLNESPVTCCRYLADCPGDLIPALYMVGSKSKKEGTHRGFSSGEWPVYGGLDNGTESCSYTELVITGHADGSVRFWDASATAMQALYRIKTSKYFEKAKKAGFDGLEDDPYAVMQIALCADCRMMAVAGASAQVILFNFKKKETLTETKCMEIPIVYEVSNLSQGVGGNSAGSPSGPHHFEFPPRPMLHVASQSSAYTDPGDGFNFDKITYEYFSPLKLRAGAQKKQPGYHAELVCLTPWVNGEAPSPVGCLSVNSNFGLMAYGNGSGLVIVDIVQNVCLLNMGTADLYGSTDPFHRMPKSPRPLDVSPMQEIVRVDLSNYSQVTPLPQSTTTPSGVDKAKETSVDGGADKSANNKENVMTVPSRDIRVKSPDCRRLQKASSSADDSSFSKSQSSSINSLDQVIQHEGVCCVEFVDSFALKGDHMLNSTLFIGTTLGSVIIVIINLPDRGDPRTNEPVVVSPSGSLMRIRGPMLTMGFLDSSSAGLTTRNGEQLENVRAPARPHSTSPPAGAGKEEIPPTGDQQVAIFCTEKSAAVYGLPSQKQMYCQTINESSSVICAEIINFGGVRYTPCLVCYTADGYIKAYSVPSLRPMLDMYFVAMSTPRVGRTMSFAHFGHGLYFANPTELQKFSISVDFIRQLPDMTGVLFSDAVPMPEPPKQVLGLLKGFFGGGPKPLDREELFGEGAGKASSSVAKNFTGASMAPLQSKGISSNSEIAKAKMAVVERGQRLNELEDRTEMMANEAKQYASTSHNLMNMYKNKKWYQL